MACFLVSYRPLALSDVGRLAAARHGLPLFIDGSCRREPDFESAFPSITGLCRTHMFVPRLTVGDEIVYITVKSTFRQTNVQQHYRLVAHLRVIGQSDSHDDAAAWYASQGLPIPSNCMVAGSKPCPYDQTNGRNDGVFRNKSDEQKLRGWDGEYRKRSRTVGRVIHTKSEFLELNSPPLITVGDMASIFGRVPGTQNPPSLPCEQIHRLVDLARSRLSKGTNQSA